MIINPRVKDQLSSPTKSRGSEPLPVRALVLELAPGFRVSDGGPNFAGFCRQKPWNAGKCWKCAWWILMMIRYILLFYFSSQWFVFFLARLFPGIPPAGDTAYTGGACKSVGSELKAETDTVLPPSTCAARRRSGDLMAKSMAWYKVVPP